MIFGAPFPLLVYLADACRALLNTPRLAFVLLHGFNKRGLFSRTAWAAGCGSTLRGGLSLVSNLPAFGA